MLNVRNKDKIVFWGGGVGTQRRLYFGAPEEVRKEMNERCQIFGKERDYGEVGLNYLLRFYDKNGRICIWHKPKQNMLKALRRIEKNKGALGIDNLTVESPKSHLCQKMVIHL